MTPTAPLPTARLQPGIPFNVVGVDHAGPLYCIDFPGQKFYILLFTCGVIRAVHLELVASLTCAETVLAFRRFFARRGLSAVIYSDNARTFVATRDVLLRNYQAWSPEWRFIPPLSPWWGGWWERMIRTIKTALRKTLGNRTATRIELETMLHEVEACVNSRPLTFVTTEVDCLRALTPSHFLIGRPIYQGISDDQGPQTSLRESKAARDNLMKHFWEVWSTLYIRELPIGSSRAGRRHRPFRVGDLVLVEETSRSRTVWPLGRVTKVHPGRDGVIRSVTIQTQKGELQRAVQRLRALEVEDQEGEDFL